MPLLNIALPGRFQISAVWTPGTFQRALLRNHHAFLATRQVEDLAVATRNGGFSVADTTTFVKAVCSWGNYPGIAGKAVSVSRAASTARTLATADGQLAAGRVATALATVQTIYGLRRMSFASKHLRMLVPDKAVVLDSIIRDRLGYPHTPAGYQLLLDDCALIRDDLNASGTPNPVELNGPWRLCDVEMALFSIVRGF